MPDQRDTNDTSSTVLERRLYDDAETWRTAPAPDLHERIMRTITAAPTRGSGEGKGVPLGFPRSRLAPRLIAAAAVAVLCLVGARQWLWAPSSVDPGAGSFVQAPGPAPGVSGGQGETSPANGDSFRSRLETLARTASDPIADRARAAWEEASMHQELVALRSDVQSITDTVRRRVTVAGLTTFSRD